MKEETKYILYFKNGKSLGLNQEMANKMSEALDSGAKFITVKNDDNEVHTIINSAEISHLTNNV